MPKRCWTCKGEITGSGNYCSAKCLRDDMMNRATGPTRRRSSKGAAKGGARKSVAKKSVAKKSVAKKSSAKKSSAKKSSRGRGR